MPTENYILRENMLYHSLYKLILTDKNVYFCQPVSNKQFAYDIIIPIQEIQDISLINEAIKILIFHIYILYIKEGYLP